MRISDNGDDDSGRYGEHEASKCAGRHLPGSRGKDCGRKRCADKDVENQYYQLSQLPLLDEQHAIRAKSCAVIGRRLEDLGLPPLGQPAGVEQEPVYKYPFRWPADRRRGVSLKALAPANAS